MPIPDVLVIHAGGNDMIPAGRRGVKEALFSTFSAIRNMLPDTTIFWSEVIPRQVWANRAPVKAVNKSVRRLNQSVSEILKGSRIRPIRHKLIQVERAEMYAPDGVHLSNAGMELFIHAILGALVAELVGTGGGGGVRQ